MEKQKEIHIWTDGSSFNNPGPGGYGVVLTFGDYRKELSGGFRRTTNNRMEILAAVMALRALNPKHRYKVIIHTDSELVCNAFNKGWIFNWEKKNWAKRLNDDLWKKLLAEYRRNDVQFQWVKAHVGIPENERCDELAKEAASGSDLPPDEVYEALNKK